MKYFWLLSFVIPAIALTTGEKFIDRNEIDQHTGVSSNPRDYVYKPSNNKHLDVRKLGGAGNNNHR